MRADAAPEAEAVLAGVWAMLREKHEAEITRIVAAQLAGLSTRVWYDHEAEAFRFDVID